MHEARDIEVSRFESSADVLQVTLTSTKNFLSILSIKCGNWFYWADRAERADRAESKESPLFTRILEYVACNQRFTKMSLGRIPPSPPFKLFIYNYLRLNPLIYTLDQNTRPMGK